MQAHVTVIFDAHRTLHWDVPLAPDPQQGQAARAWFDARWEALECEPLRVSGKVLLLDKILGVADALGYRTLSTQPDVAAEFAQQALHALGKPRITVDLPGLTIGY